MAGDKPRARIGRGYARDLDVGTFRPMIDSFELHLRAQHKSEKTIRIYLEAALWLAAGYLIPVGLSDWGEIRRVASRNG
jgi:integrase/recombinase XerD